jgi:hypothetical protein
MYSTAIGTANNLLVAWNSVWRHPGQQALTFSATDIQVFIDSLIVQGDCLNELNRSSHTRPFFWCNFLSQNTVWYSFPEILWVGLAAKTHGKCWNAEKKLCISELLSIKNIFTFAKKLDSLYTCLSSSQCSQAFCTLRALYGNAQPYMFLHFFAVSSRPGEHVMANALNHLINFGLPPAAAF